MSIKINDTKARRKQDSAMELLRVFGPYGFLMEDALEFFKTSMMAKELDFDPVGIITGMLRRSYSAAGVYDRQPYVIRLFPNLTIAPYAIEVSERIQRRFGNSFVQITLDRTSIEADAAIRREIERAATIIQAGQRYIYENPFPAVGGIAA